MNSGLLTLHVLLHCGIPSLLLLLHVYHFHCCWMDPTDLNCSHRRCHRQT
jgi:hypothetical protein